MENASPSSSGRSRREKKEKPGRFAAFQKIKELKATGSKHKYEVGEIENVYDEVDEKEYVKKLMERQQSDWIVDDGGGDGGYVEDGREIFDDDMDPESIAKNSREMNKNSAGAKKRKRIEEQQKTTTTKSNNIMSMFQGMPTKKKREDKPIANADDIMASMLKQLEEEKLNEKKIKPVKNKFSVAAAAAAAKPLPKEQPKQIEHINNDDEMMEIVNATIFDPPSSPTMKKEIKPKKIFQEIEKETKPQDYTDLIEEDFSDDFILEDVDPPAQSTPSHSAPELNKNNELEKDEFPDILFSIDDADVAACPTTTVPEEKDTLYSLSLKKIRVPITTNKNGDNVVRFYWLDAAEDTYKQPGVVNLFGKVYHKQSNKYVSCTLSVKNIPRRIYCLPRVMKKNSNGEEEPNTMKDVYEEWNKLATLNNIKEYRSQPVNKYYAFDRESTPIQSDYLEVRYSTSFPAVDSNYEGNSIEHIFGTTANALEIFLIERKIMGPCWLEIKEPILVNFPGVWSELQVNCLDMKYISVYEKPDNPSDEEKKEFIIPAMSMMILNICATLNPKNQKNEIAMIGVLSNGNYPIDKPPIKPVFEEKCFVTHPRDKVWPLYAQKTLVQYKDTKVIFCKNETDLLEKFLDYFQEFDADLLIGYDCGFQFDVLMRRLTDLKIKNWMRTSKLKSVFVPLYKGKINISRSFCGRVVCDVQVAAKEVNVKVRSYDLDSICSAVLNTKPNTIINIKPADCPDYYDKVDKLIQLVKITMKEAKYMLSLICKMDIIPLALQITCIAGNVLSRTFNAGRAERNEYLLLHAFSKQGYIIPDRKVQAKKSAQESTRKKAAFTGGLVLDPKKGFYDQLILLMDFNSLYPSIIQEYNLCFTTIHGVCYRELDTSDIPDENVKFGIIPTQIRQLVQRRIGVKQELKNPNLTEEKKMELNIRQLAYKLTANSMYGCLGATHSRFYAKNLAALVTLKGREILQNTKSLVEKLNYQVIYGDTDSIMINSKITNYDDALGIAKKIKSEVNKLYKGIELDIDGLFKYMLLLNKKKYAAVVLTKLPNGQFDTKTEIKGLDIVRRDWCQLASDTGRQIINKIFTDLPIEEKISNIRDYLIKISDNVKKLSNDARNDKAPLAPLVITKQLSKNPQDYPDKRQPHVAIALRLNRAGGRMWKAGDTVPYVICRDSNTDDTTTKTPMERAYHIDEYKKNTFLNIDIDYYFRLQIIPVLERITIPLPELDGNFLAECLGITNYKSKLISGDGGSNNTGAGADDDDDDNYDERRFDNCEPFTFRCRNDNCNTLNEITGFFVKTTTKIPAMLACTNENCKLPPWKYINAIQNDLKIAIKDKLKKYYQRIICCDNPACKTSAKTFRIFDKDKIPRCIKCLQLGVKREYTEIDLHNQLEYYQYIFTPIDGDSTSSDTQSNKQKYPTQVIAACNTLEKLVDQYLKRSNYSVVNFNQLLNSTRKNPWDAKANCRLFSMYNHEAKYKESRKVLCELAFSSRIK